MPQIDISDRTWIAATRQVVAAEVGNPDNWRRWWPDLDLVVTLARGVEGVQWSVRSGADRTAGSMEIWLQPMFDGVLLHYFLRLDPTDGPPIAARRAVRIKRRHALHAKQVFWPLKDRLEDRSPAPRR